MAAGSIDLNKMGVHIIKVEVSTSLATPEDWIAHDRVNFRKSTHDGFRRTYPLLYQRYHAEAEAIKEAEDKFPFDTQSESTPVSSDGRGLDDFQESLEDRGSRTVAVNEWIHSDIGQYWDGRPLNLNWINLTDTQAGAIDRAIAWILTNPPELQHAENIKDGHKCPTGLLSSREDRYSVAVSIYFSKITSLLSGSDENAAGHDTFVFGGHTYLGDIDDSPAERVDKTKMNILRKLTIALSSNKNTRWSDLATGGVVQLLPALDMKTLFADESPVIEGCRYERRKIRNHPAAGRSYFFTLCGSYLRLFFVDPGNIIATRAYNIFKPDHAKDVVKIIALLSGPDARVLQSWQPPAHSVTCSVFSQEATPRRTGTLKLVWEAESTETKEAARERRAVDKIKKGGKSKKERKVDKNRIATNKELLVHLLDARAAIWGRRTAVWRTMASLRAEAPPVSVILKSAWLPPRLVHYELKMLHRMNETSTSPLLAANDPIVPPLIRSSVPIPVGMVDLPNSTIPWVTNERLCLGDEFSEKTLEFSVFAMQGPVGRRVDADIDNLSLRDVSAIYLGAMQALFLASSHNVHFRDLNLGNIVSARSPSGELYGFLIDYGNSRYKNERKDPLRDQTSSEIKNLCQDDRRSGNTTFLCTSVAKAVQQFDAYKGFEQYFQDEIPAGLRNAPHRYIDDLESILYCLLYQVAKRMDSIDGVPIKIFRALRTGLENHDRKEFNWNDGLKAMSEIIPCNGAWAVMIQKVAGIVKLAQEELRKLPELAPEMTSLEANCFRDCIKAVQTALKDLPETGWV